MFTKIKELCAALTQNFADISTTRKASLLQLSDYIANKYQQGETPQLIVICTHNSRRSHIGQLWLAIAADYYQLPAVQTYSGGTEATAFNHRAVQAFKAQGLTIQTEDSTVDNPIYQVAWKADMPAYQAFSKKYDIEPNPKADFAAIMVCNSADKGCPIVAGCDFRLSLPYEDPKAFDDTLIEQEKYTERIHQIGRDILFVFHTVAQQIK